MEPPKDVKERLRASYNSMSNTYNAWTARHNHLRLAYLDELLARCPELTSEDEKHTVLEVGCGAGKPFLETLLSRAPAVHAHANDLSDLQVDLARANLAAYKDRVDFHPGDMTKLDFAPGSLAAVVGLYTIIHLDQEEQAAMLRRIGGWLRPGGILVANFPVHETAGVVFEEWLHKDGWMYWSGLGKEGTVDALKAGGLEVEKVEVEGDTEEKFLWIVARKIGS
ncbi:hypothetical protein ACO1O0_005261 [Amphichorda felina]